MKHIVVVGGGAGGMIAAYAASVNGSRVTLIERNEKLGKKIYITGKGRCNLTNAAQIPEFFDGVFRGRSFSYSSVYRFGPPDLIELIESTGIKTKIERGNRVFPQSDKASDVTKAFLRLLDKPNIEMLLNTFVEKVMIEGGEIKGVKTDKGEIPADAVILSCGGKSYPSTGSDGNGYSIAKLAGHHIDELSAALVELYSPDPWVHGLAGLSLVNVGVSLYDGGKKKYSEFGEMLFTHKGISGPCALTLSCLVAECDDPKVFIDLKPALDHKKLDERILRDFDEIKNKDAKCALDKLMPRALASQVITLSQIDPNKKVNQITARERKDLIELMKSLPVNISGKAGFNEAVITDGGVSLSQVNPSTMESKLVKNLYFAGEMLNLHGFTGGYNLQLAFSTGMLAGISAGEAAKI